MMHSKWTEKRVTETLRRWRSNEASYMEIVAELVWLGYNHDAAAWLVIRT